MGEIFLNSRIINCYFSGVTVLQIVAKVTKHFKGRYCPIRHVRTRVTTSFDAHYEKNGLVLFSTSFFAEYIMPYIFRNLSRQLNDASKILKSEACI